MNSTLSETFLNILNRSTVDSDTTSIAATNGVLLNEVRKEWFRRHRDRFFIRLGLDGTPETHGKNRCNSFDSIDVDFSGKHGLIWA